MIRRSSGACAAARHCSIPSVAKLMSALLGMTRTRRSVSEVGYACKSADDDTEFQDMGQPVHG